MKRDLLIFILAISVVILFVMFSNPNVKFVGENKAQSSQSKIPDIIEIKDPDPKPNLSGVDTVIDAGNYKSHFDIDRKQPVFVSYVLYKGGGDCNRSGFRFKNDTNIKMATSKDYSGTGFDMGHLANAEDFAGNCIAGEKTFRFYNCLPQYPNLNRGVWKRWETKARDLSQRDSLLIICGGTFSNEVIGENVYVPDYCWKVIYSLKTKKVWKVLWFKNVSRDSDKYFEELTLEKLEERLKYKLKMIF